MAVRVLGRHTNKLMPKGEGGREGEAYAPSSSDDRICPFSAPLPGVAEALERWDLHRVDSLPREWNGMGCILVLRLRMTVETLS